MYKLYPGGRKAVALTVENLSCDAAFLDKTAAEFYNRAADRFSVDFWHDQDRAMMVRMLRMLCRELFGSDLPLSMAAVERFENMVREKRNGICVLDEERKIRFSGGRILAVSEVPATVSWEYGRMPEIRWGKWRFSVKKAENMPQYCSLFTACFDSAELPEILEIGAPEPGERMLPFGRHEAVKIKDLRIKRKVPALPVCPAVRDRHKKVIWLPGIRHSGEYPVRSGGEIMIFCAENVEDFD